MKTLEATGKTYEEALMAGLAQMGLPSDKVDVEVLEEGSKGFLGIGAKPYRLRLTKKDTPALRAEEFLQNVTELMGLDVVLDVQDEEEALRIEMQGDNQGILIGHRGETLDALQYLTSLLVNKGGKDYRRVTLDTEGYRAKREQTLINLANRMAAKVQRSGRRMVLEPMNPYERRILHATLQDNPHVTTHSEGGAQPPRGHRAQARLKAPPAGRPSEQTAYVQSGDRCTSAPLFLRGKREKGDTKWRIRSRPSPRPWAWAALPSSASRGPERRTFCRASSGRIVQIVR